MSWLSAERLRRVSFGAPLRLLGASTGLVLGLACSSYGGGESDSEGAPSSGTGDIEVGAVGDGDGALPIQGGFCTIEKADNDGDGFTVEQGDCNDCDENANPGALDVPDNGVDEDCDGRADNEPECDAELDNPGSLDALEAAAAIDLCATTSAEGRTWGIIEASYRLADGTPFDELDAAQAGRSHRGHALLERFGDEVVPRRGTRFLSLSTGVAGNPTAEDPTWYARSGHQQLSSVSPPDGFPSESPACPEVVATNSPKANDSVMLELSLRAPTNARSFSFDFYYFTYEFPEYVCHDYNDNFVVLMDPPPADAPDGNVAFDDRGNPISVNSAYLEVCDAQDAAAFGLERYECPFGTTELQGTGYEMTTPTKTTQSGATGWLSTTVPVEPGQEFTLRFVIWDAGETANGATTTPDTSNDSTVLIDNLSFSAAPASQTATLPAATR